MTDQVVELDVGFVASGGAPLPVLYQTDATTVLAFFGRATDRDEERLRVVVEFDTCMVSTFGYPNDEAIPGHPLYRAGLGFGGVYEVLDSSWKQRIIAQNEVCFPRTPPQYYELRHFVFVLHDSMFECLAQSFEARFTSDNLGRILTPYVQRGI